jgi:hypothetical protein
VSSALFFHGSEKEAVGIKNMQQLLGIKVLDRVAAEMASIST